MFAIGDVPHGHFYRRNHRVVVGAAEASFEVISSNNHVLTFIV